MNRRLLPAGIFALGLLASAGCAEDKADARLPVPGHLSQGAKNYYGLNPQPVSALDLDDANAVAETRAAIETAWRARLPEFGLAPFEQPVELGGVRAIRISLPSTNDDGRLIVYLHGGAYIVGSASANVVLPTLLAAASGIPVLSVDYRMAPEHPFPAALDDALAVLQSLFERGQDPRKLVVMGDSAGGGLALAVVMKLKRINAPMPAGLALISPWADLSRGGDSNTTLESADPVITWSETLVGPARAYAGAADPANPFISPVYGDFSRMPPMLVQAGSREVLLSDSVRVVRNARRAGVDVRFDVWDGMWHVFQDNPGVAEAEEAVGEMAEFVLDVTKPAELQLIVD